MMVKHTNLNQYLYFIKNKDMIKYILNKIKSIGIIHKTPMKVHDGELTITKKGKVKSKK